LIKHSQSVRFKRSITRKWELLNNE
jgi:hypothetical protein